MSFPAKAAETTETTETASSSCSDVIVVGDHLGATAKQMETLGSEGVGDAKQKRCPLS